MPKFSVGQSVIHFYDDNPSGIPPVLLLHGLGVDGSSWGYQLPALINAGIRPIAPDIPGFGESSFGGKGWSIHAIANSLDQFLSYLAIDRIIVVGISMGGVIAQQFVLAHPGRVSKLVLVNTFASLRPKRINQMVYLVSRFLIANIRGIRYQSEMVARRLFPLPEQSGLRQEMVDRILRADPKAYKAAMRSLGLFNSRKRLGEISIPTLVVSGANDSTVSLPNQMELVHGISRAKHVIIENTGHAVITDQPDRFNEVLINFIMESS